MDWIIICMRGILMGNLFSRPKPPPPPPPVVTQTLTAKEKQVQADELQETKVTQSKRKARGKGGRSMSSMLLASGVVRPDYLEPAKTKLGVAGRNPRVG